MAPAICPMDPPIPIPTQKSRSPSIHRSEFVSLKLIAKKTPTEKKRAYPIGFDLN